MDIKGVMAVTPFFGFLDKIVSNKHLFENFGVETLRFGVLKERRLKLQYC